MNKELEIKEYLGSLTYRFGEGSVVAVDSLGEKVWSVEFHGDDVNSLPEATLVDLLKDEIIHRKFPEYWISMFVQGKSTAGLF
jgi:hypothetical protein